MTSYSENHEKISKVISLINAAVSNIRLYSSQHPQANRYLEDAYDELSVYLLDKPLVTIMLVDDQMVVDNAPMNKNGIRVDQFIRILRDNAVEHISFESGISRQEFDSFVKRLADSESDTINSSSHLKLGRLQRRVNENTAEQVEPTLSEDEKQYLSAICSVRDEKFGEIKALYRRISKHKRVDIRAIDDLIKAFIRGFSYGINPLHMLVKLKSVDEYTFTHVVNVCILTMSQAESLGFKGEQLYQIGVASVLHDSGKLFIPNEILNKPGRLTDRERSIMETHTIKGAQYILGLKHIPKLAVLGCLEHHIKYDGTGYPNISKRWKPNVVSQMIAIADVFDAMRSRRVYKEPKPKSLIERILTEEKGTSFNPLLVDNFLKLIDAC